LGNKEHYTKKEIAAAVILKDKGIVDGSLSVMQSCPQNVVFSLIQTLCS